MKSGFGALLVVVLCVLGAAEAFVGFPGIDSSSLTIRDPRGKKGNMHLHVYKLD